MFSPPPPLALVVGHGQVVTKVKQLNQRPGEGKSHFSDRKNHPKHHKNLSASMGFVSLSKVSASLMGLLTQNLSEGQKGSCGGSGTGNSASFWIIPKSVCSKIWDRAKLLSSCSWKSPRPGWMGFKVHSKSILGIHVSPQKSREFSCSSH